MRRAVASACLALLTAGCAQLVEYSDELIEPKTGRTPLVIWPATAGQMLGFVLGVPVDLVAFPVTWSVHQVQKANNQPNAELVSTVLFPSFALGRGGAILFGAPFDAVEFAVYRAWLPPEAMDRELRENLEVEIDDRTMPRYPVIPIFGETGAAESRPGGA
jgi:hypothetical protein